MALPPPPIKIVGDYQWDWMIIFAGGALMLGIIAKPLAAMRWVKRRFVALGAGRPVPATLAPFRDVIKDADGDIIGVSSDRTNVLPSREGHYQGTPVGVTFREQRFMAKMGSGNPLYWVVFPLFPGGNNFVDMIFGQYRLLVKARLIGARPHHFRMRRSNNATVPPEQAMDPKKFFRLYNTASDDPEWLRRLFDSPARPRMQQLDRVADAIGGLPISVHLNNQGELTIEMMGVTHPDDLKACVLAALDFCAALHKQLGAQYH